MPQERQEPAQSFDQLSLPARRSPDLVLGQGKFLRLVKDSRGYERAERTKCSGVVAILGVTPKEELLLTEQFRPNVNARVLDLAAGLAGDKADDPDENFMSAAARELQEETGYKGAALQFLFEKPTSPGLTSETVRFYHAKDLTHESDDVGCKEENERITRHLVPLSDIDRWLEEKSARGCFIDPKVDVALNYLRSVDYAPSAGTSACGVTQARLLRQRIAASMEAIALGDALGLPVETWSRERIRAEVGSIRTLLPVSTNPFMSKGNFPRGSVSDDTQLSAAMLYTLLAAGCLDLPLLAHFHLRAVKASSLGYGRTTLDAIYSWGKGAPLRRDPGTLGPGHGYGNGVAMKIAPLAWLARIQGWSDRGLGDACVEVAKMTHPTHLGAESAIAQAFAIRYCLEQTPETFQREGFLAAVERGLSLLDRNDPELKPTPEYELRARLAQVRKCLESETPERAAALLGNGSCCAYDSIPFTFYFFLRNPTSIDSLYEVIEAGGDTDSNGSMVGALVGALNGPGILPQTLTDEIVGIEEYRGLVERFVNSARSERRARDGA